MQDIKEINWLNHIYKQSPIALGVYLGKELIIEFANQKMCELWGRNFEQVQNLPLFEAIPEIGGQGYEEILDNVLNTGVPYTGVEVPAAIKKNGKLAVYFFNILYEPMRNEDGSIYGVFQTAVDVSLSVKSRLKVERDSEILQSALDAGKMGTWFYDMVENSYTTSLIHDQIFGTQEKFSIWNTDIFMNYVLPEDRPDVLRKVAKSFKTGNLSYDTRIQWEDKSIHWIRIVGKVIFNLAGKPISLSGIIMDITDLKSLAEKERQVVVEHAARLEAEKQRKVLYNLFMEAPSVICVLRGPDMVFELVNPPTQEKLFPGRNILGLPLLEAIPEMKGQINFQILENVYTTGESFHGKEVPVAIKKGNCLEYFWFNFVYQPLFDENRSVIGILAFAFDITEQIVARKKLSDIKDVLEQKNQQLTRTNNDLDNFVYTASHDLRAPISNLEGLLLSYFSDAETNEDQEPLVKMMFESIERFKQTIKDLTEIVDVQKGITEDFKQLRFDTMLEDVKQSINSLIQVNKVEILGDFKIEEITFSRKNLRSILYNLISNGIKYSSPNRIPEIRVSTYYENNYLVLSISDNGMGMEEKNRYKIFNMFKRLHNHVEGSGIGLYIVKRIIENAGGKIELESEVDKGTTFKIYFLQEHVCRTLVN